MGPSTDKKLFRVHGLQSTRGRGMNGMLCKSYGQAENAPGRLSCWVDGEPDMVAIKQSNLIELDTPDMETLRMALKWTLTYDTKRFDVLELKRVSTGEIADLSSVSADLPSWLEKGGSRVGLDYRSDMPCLLGLVPSVKFVQQASGKKILIMTDNLFSCRAINYHSVGLTDCVDPKNVEFLDRLIETTGFVLFAKFEVDREYTVAPECPLERSDAWYRRLQAANAGRVIAYPCSCDGYLDCSEVRYSPDGIESFQEIRRHSVYEFPKWDGFSNSGYRLDLLHPETMAKVDPGAFWEAFARTYQLGASHATSSAASLLASKWRSFIPGTSIGHSLIASMGHAWPCVNEYFAHKGSFERYKTEGRQGSILGALAACDPSGCMASPTNFKSQQHLKHHLLPCYYDSPLEEAMLCLQTDHIGDNNDNLISDPFANTLRVKCNVCQSKKNVKECDGCGRVAYCSKECQKKAWKYHRTLCASKRRSVGKGAKGVA